MSIYDFNTQILHNGAILCSTVVNGQWVHMTYMGYSVQEAKRRFIDEINNELTRSV